MLSIKHRKNRMKIKKAIMESDRLATEIGDPEFATGMKRINREWLEIWEMLEARCSKDYHKAS